MRSSHKQPLATVNDRDFLNLRSGCQRHLKVSGNGDGRQRRGPDARRAKHEGRNVARRNQVVRDASKTGSIAMDTNNQSPCYSHLRKIQKESSSQNALARQIQTRLRLRSAMR